MTSLTPRVHLLVWGLLAAMLAPPGSAAQEATPIGGEWAPFDCPMPVTGMSSNRARSPAWTTPDGHMPAEDTGLREDPMPVLSRRCFNPLALRLQPTGSVRIRLAPDLYHPPGRLNRDPFGLDGSLHMKVDSMSPRFVPEAQPRFLPR